jgi:uncharacterized protein (TIGR02246 family)
MMQGENSPMLRRVLLTIVLVVSPMLAYASPKEDSQAVFDRFLAALTAADVDGVVGVFWPDALFWGTTRTDLSTTPEALRAYFNGVVGNMKPNDLKATSLGTSALVVSDSVVLISGLWQVERVVDGKPTLFPGRVSFAVTKRGDEWRIAQFHNSVRPVK